MSKLMRATALLRNVPVLAGLSDPLLEQLADELQEVRVRAGNWITREDDIADSMFIVRSGRVDVVDEGPPETLIRILRRGDVLGELALLRQGTRSASVRARRDVELLELGRGAFEALIQQAPSFALGLTRAMGAQLAASRTPVAASVAPQTIAVVGLDAAAPVAEVAQDLTRALAGHGSIATLSSGDLATIDRAERDAERVLLEAGSEPENEWTSICVREAHLVLAVTTGMPSPAWLARANALHDCELLVLGPTTSTDVIAELQPREVQVLAEVQRRSAALEATARRIAGRSLGIVLSGGGARAMAHLGAIEELVSAGLRFDRIAGVSLGSLVAAATARGLDSESVYEGFERNFVSTNPTSDFTIPAFSLLRGAKTRRLLEEEFGESRIEELPLRFFSVSCDLIGRKPVVHRTGSLADAVYASLAIPGVFPPVSADGRLLVDGGVLDNLPVETMARSGQGPIIAVDVTGRMGGEFGGARRPGVERLRRPVRRVLTGSQAPLPRLGETIVRSMTVGSIDTVTAARLHADLVITPDIEGVGLMEWRALPRVRQLGRDAARRALDSHPEFAGRLAG